MDYAGEYIYSVIAAAIIISILVTIVGTKTGASNVLRLTSGIFLIIVVLSPIVKLSINNALDYISNIETDASFVITDAENETNEAIAKVIKDQIESYILAKAADLGAEISVVLLFEENNWYQPERVTISGSASPFARNQLKSYIATDLGIPEESQIWILQ